MSDAPKYPLLDQIREVGREIGLRKSVYKKFVASGRMTQNDSDELIGKMEAAYQTLKWVERHQVRLRALAPELLEDHPSAIANVEPALTAVLLIMDAYQETKAASGKIACPKCSADLHWSRSSSNGHFRGACSTPKCVEFIQ